MKEHAGRTLEEATIRLVITGLCNLVVLVLAIQSAGAQGVIDFQTFGDNVVIFDQYEGSFGVTFEIVANGVVVGFPKIGVAGPPLTGFTGCPSQAGDDTLLGTAHVFGGGGAKVADVLPPMYFPLTGKNHFFGVIDNLLAGASLRPLCHVVVRSIT